MGLNQIDQDVKHITVAKGHRAVLREMFETHSGRIDGIRHSLTLERNEKINLMKVLSGEARLYEKVDLRSC